MYLDVLSRRMVSGLGNRIPITHAVNSVEPRRDQSSLISPSITLLLLPLFLIQLELLTLTPKQGDSPGECCDRSPGNEPSCQVTNHQGKHGSTVDNRRDQTQ